MEEEGRESHRPKVHIGGAITFKGAISLKIFEENSIVNTIYYLQIFRKKVKELKEKFPENFFSNRTEVMCIIQKFVWIIFMI